MDSFFVYDPGSPFKRDSSITYTGIKWYPVDPRYAVRSAIHRYENPDTVDVMGTKGETRRQLRYGYFEFALPDTNGMAVPVRLNVYKFTPYDGKRYALFRDHLSVWFTDPTSGVETYHVGPLRGRGCGTTGTGARIHHRLQQGIQPVLLPTAACTPVRFPGRKTASRHRCARGSWPTTRSIDAAHDH